MASWVGYLKVHSGGSYSLSMSNGQGSICVQEQGFIPFGAAGVTVDLPEAGDYPVNLSVPGASDDEAAKAAFTDLLRKDLREMKPKLDEPA